MIKILFKNINPEIMLSTSLIYEIVLATHAIQNFHSQIQAHDLCHGPAYCVQYSTMLYSEGFHFLCVQVSETTPQQGSNDTAGCLVQLAHP